MDYTRSWDLTTLICVLQSEDQRSGNMSKLEQDSLGLLNTEVSRTNLPVPDSSPGGGRGVLLRERRLGRGILRQAQDDVMLERKILRRHHERVTLIEANAMEFFEELGEDQTSG
jgi:hypothetical protein